MAARSGFWRVFWLGCGAVAVLTALVIALGTGLFGFRLYQLEWSPQGQTDLRFREVALGFENRADISETTGSLPFMASVVIDIDGDGRDEIVLGGGRGQADGLFGYDDGADAFIDISGDHDVGKSADDATMGGASIDVDGDGATDLILARESGIWLYLNRGGRLSGARLELDIEEGTTPLSIALGDVNADGRVDLYVSGYVRNALVEGQAIFTEPYGGYSHFFLSDGEGWRDASRAYGLWRRHNTFTAVFADIDADADADIVIAQDTGRVEIYENVGAPPFRPVENPSVFSYPMGVAAGDFNADGRLDLYFSNVGHTLPRALVRGDLPAEAEFNERYMLFENRGGLEFEDVAERRDAARLGFGWGVVAADLDLDGFEDIVVAQNYAKLDQPFLIQRYRGRILRNIDGERFEPVERRAGAGNRLFAISPLIGDFNGDHLPDLVWANLQGPSRAFLNATEGRNWIEIRLPDTAASLNARIEIGVGERVLVRQVLASQGMASDSSHVVRAGLGAAQSAEEVRITFLDGRERVFQDVPAGSVLELTD